MGLGVTLSRALMTKAVSAEYVCGPDFGAAKHTETHAFKGRDKVWFVVGVALALCLPLCHLL